MEWLAPLIFVGLPLVSFTLLLVVVVIKLCVEIWKL